MRFTLALLALLFAAPGVLSGRFSSHSSGGCRKSCCAAKAGGPPASTACQPACKWLPCKSFPVPIPTPPSKCPPKVCCERWIPTPCQPFCSRARVDCRCDKDDCCGPNKRPSCRSYCFENNVNCGPPKKCPDTRLCCENPVPESCKEECKFVKQDCRCKPEIDCCALIPRQECRKLCSLVDVVCPPKCIDQCCQPDGIGKECPPDTCATILCPGPRPFPPVPKPGDNGGCNTTNCCPPGKLTEECKRKNPGLCAAVTCAAPPSNCRPQSCCPKPSFECKKYCGRVDCKLPCCPPVEIQGQDKPCRDCGLKG